MRGEAGVHATAVSPRGEVTLRERRGRDGGAVLELRVNGVFVMDTEETSTERALAHAALGALGEVVAPLRILVGGLGLGFTLAELQRDRRVGAITVVEIEEAVVAWHREGLIPDGPELLSDPRTSVIIADVATAIRDSTAGFDLILLDVDNGPRYLVHEQNAALYRQEFLEACAHALAAGGIVCIWAANEAEDLRAAMAAVFGDVEVIRGAVRLQQRDEQYLLYLARLTSTM